METPRRFPYWNLSSKKLVLWYSGENFLGFQNQPQGRTVANELGKALNRLYKQPIAFKGAGRTDTGVHANGQVISVKTPFELADKSIQNGLNALLPDDMRILSVEDVSIKFDPLRDAKSREYHYLFTNKDVPGYLKNRIVQIQSAIDQGILNQIAGILTGTHEFKNFRCTGSSEKSTVKHLYKVAFTRHTVQDLYSKEQTQVMRGEFLGNSFLYRMIRRIMGFTFEILSGKLQVNDLKDGLNDKAIVQFRTAPPHGLCLNQVNY